jgi:glycosyl hydrolase family 16
MASARSTLDERFAGDTLDTDVWLPHYLPHWSSRAASAATYAVRDGELRLSIPADQPLWCPDTHAEPLRVSCVQSAGRSGQQPFRDGLAVREEQPEFRGYTPLYGHVEVRMRGVVTARSMVAFWMSGVEERPEQSGEICVAEIFGDAVRPGSADVGIGVKAFRDPALRQEFAAEPLPIDVAAFHTYGVDWGPGSLVFTVDGEVVRRLEQAPDYPVQLMIGVFDFPAAAPGTPTPVPELVVSAVRGHPLG